MHYQNLLIAALAIGSPFTSAFPLADPEPVKGAPATTKEPENQNIYAKPTWLTVPNLTPFLPKPTTRPEPATTKGEEQQDHGKPTPVATTHGEAPAQSSRAAATHGAEGPKGGNGKNERAIEEIDDEEWERIEGRIGDMEREFEVRWAQKPTGGFTGNPDTAPAPTATAKPTQHFTVKPDTEPAPTAMAKPTQHFTVKPDTEPVPTATGKPTQYFTVKPDTEPVPVATAKPTQHFTGKPDVPPTSPIKIVDSIKPTDKPVTPPTDTIKSIEPPKPTQSFTEKPDAPPSKTIEPVKPTQIFTEKPDTLPSRTVEPVKPTDPIKPTTFITKYYGGPSTPSPSLVKANTFGPVLESGVGNGNAGGVTSLVPLATGTGKPAGGKDQQRSSSEWGFDDE